MFDYLGTFTEQQLRERHAHVRAHAHAIPRVIESLRNEQRRLAHTVADDTEADGRVVSHTREQDGRVYQLGTTSIPMVANPVSSLAGLTETLAVRSKFPVRVDPVTGDISLGDHPWRPAGRRFMVSSTPTTMEDVAHDDTVAAVMSDRLMRPLRGLMKRQEALEEKNKKAKSVYGQIQDQIDELQRTYDNLESELEAIEGLLATRVSVPTPTGGTEEQSPYATAGVENIAGMVDPTSSEVGDLFEFILPTSTTSEEGDAVADHAVPVVPGLVAGPEGPFSSGNFSVPDFRAQFPNCNLGTGKHTIADWKMQWLANVWGYGRNQLTAIPESESLFFKDSRVGRYVAANVALLLIEWADYVYATHGCAIRITEAWPPKVEHASPEHFTGNAVDVTFAKAVDGKLVWTGGFITDALLDDVIDYGIKHHLFTKHYDHYRGKETYYSNAPHLHLQWSGKDALYLTDARLKNVTTGAS